MSGLVLDGVTGAGKTRTLDALREHPDFAALLGSGRVFTEEETFGEVMAEIALNGNPERHLWRMEAVVPIVESAPPSSGFVLERFHPSYYALLPDWRLYEAIDKRLALLGFSLVVLSVPEHEIASRCFDRQDRSKAVWGDAMTKHYGSRTAALDAIAESQRRRREVVASTRLPVLKIDTCAKDWSTYASNAIGWWRNHR